METILALDFGTQGLKAALMDSHRNLFGPAYSSYAYALNQNGCMEQEPEDWWRACIQACRALAERFPEAYRAVGCVSLTGQMHGMVPLGVDGEPQDRCILWCDTRSEAQAGELASLPSQQRHAMRNAPSSAYSAPKLLWLKRHRPGVLDRCDCLLYCKDYIRMRLTGERATDHTDASGSLLYDFATGGWNERLISQLGLPLRAFPSILASQEDGGAVCLEAAHLLGLRQGTPTAVGAGDLACSCLGGGLTGNRQILVNLGTAGQVMSLTDQSGGPAPGCHVFRFPLAGQNLNLASLHSAAYCLAWLSRILFPSQAGDPDIFQRMDRLAAQVPPGARGLLFTPYLSGTGTPWSDAVARASFIGLDAGHDAACMIRAVMEGVCLGIRDCIGAIRPDSPESVVFTGGGSKSRLWQSILADVLGVPLGVPQNRDATVLGAAAIGAVRAGFFPDIAKAASFPIASAVKPDPARKERYDELYTVYRSVYAAQREVMQGLSAFRRA